MSLMQKQKERQQSIKRCIENLRLSSEARKDIYLKTESELKMLIELANKNEADACRTRLRLIAETAKAEARERYDLQVELNELEQAIQKGI
jgi:hypothetical protein